MSTIDNILAAVRLELELENTQYNSWLKIVINEIIRSFNIFETYITEEKECKIDSHGYVCLPNNFYDLGVLTAQCCDTEGGVCFPYIYYQQECLNRFGYGVNNNYCERGTYQINGNRLKLLGNFRIVKSATLCYEAFNTDDYGNFIGQPIGLENAVMLRTAWRFMLKHRKDYAPDVIQSYDAMATAAFNQVKGSSGIRAFKRNRPQLLSISNAILIDKNIYRR